VNQWKALKKANITGLTILCNNTMQNWNCCLVLFCATLGPCKLNLTPRPPFLNCLLSSNSCNHTCQIHEPLVFALCLLFVCSIFDSVIWGVWWGWWILSVLSARPARSQLKRDSAYKLQSHGGLPWEWREEYKYRVKSLARYFPCSRNVGLLGKDSGLSDYRTIILFQL
jgi:hypothetical protein